MIATNSLIIIIVIVVIVDMIIMMVVVIHVIVVIIIVVVGVIVVQDGETFVPILEQFIVQEDSIANVVLDIEPIDNDLN